MKDTVKVLFCGDIVGSPGREILKKKIPSLRKDMDLDFVVVNAENAAGGSGLTAGVVDEIFSSGVDIITTGDHVWRKKDIFDIIDKQPYLLRPANYKDFLPGKGFCIKDNHGVKLCVINLVGRVFMDHRGICPFIKVRDIISDARSFTKNILVDIHAEATSEKVAMGYFLSGSASAVIGTHTHVPTADERIIDNSTAYITDVGMTGGFDSVLGRKKEKVIEHFLTDLPQKFDVSPDGIRMQAVFLEIDSSSGKALSIRRVEEKME